jgi:hypothetical protein
MTFSPLRFNGTETEIDMEKWNFQGNYIMGSFIVFILHQVKIRKIWGWGVIICMHGILRNLSDHINIINVGTNLEIMLKSI